MYKESFGKKKTQKKKKSNTKYEMLFKNHLVKSIYSISIIFFSISTISYLLLFLLLICCCLYISLVMYIHTHTSFIFFDFLFFLLLCLLHVYICMYFLETFSTQSILQSFSLLSDDILCSRDGESFCSCFCDFFCAWCASDGR